MAGYDVRLLLHGALHGKLPHHTWSRLPEIQPGQVQDIIRPDQELSGTTKYPSSFVLLGKN